MQCSCMTVKKSSSKASYTAKNAPPFCEILFIYKGKHIWTRDASEESAALAESSNSVSPEFVQSNHNADTRHTGIENWLQGESVYSELAVPSSTNRYLSHYSRTLFSPSNSSNCSRSSVERRASTDSYLRIEEETLNRRLGEALIQAEASRSEAFQELMKRQRLESEAVEVINKVITA